MSCLYEGACTLGVCVCVVVRTESEREAYVRRAFGQAGDAEAKSEDASAQRSASDSV